MDRENSVRSTGSSYSQPETSNFKSYIEDSEADERAAMLKKNNKIISSMEQATSPMNQVK